MVAQDSSWAGAHNGSDTEMITALKKAEGSLGGIKEANEAEG